MTNLATEIKLLSGVHDSATCDRDNGKPCFMCQGANEKEIADGLTEYDFEKACSDYRERFGNEKFMATIENYLTREMLY